MEQKTPTHNTERSGAIYDASTLGRTKFTILGLQHMFAMFGATILVPAITGLSVSATLLFAGIGTLLFHWITKMNLPAFLGSSFAFIGGYAAVTEVGAGMGYDQAHALPYACLGVIFAGLLYFVMALLVKNLGVNRVLRYFPPVVTGPVIISIGLVLSGSAIQNCMASWPIALVAIGIIISCLTWGKKMIAIIPILLGVVGSYLTAALCGMVDFSSVKAAPWVGIPLEWDNTAISLLSHIDWPLAVNAITTMVPIALATMVEHVGDMCAISSTVGRNYLIEPGLTRTLTGDGVATVVASLFGAPANTTYGENTGVLNLTKVFDARVIRLAAVFAILFSFSPKFSALIGAMPAATIGGVSLVLYGMISSVGVRNLVENKVDMSLSRNVLITALILVLAIGIKYGADDAVSFGPITLSGLAIGSIVGIIINAILPQRKHLGELE